MENISKKQTGHSILTYRVRLYDRHFAWLSITKELYDRVVKHFFDVLKKEETLLEQSDFLLLRTLEIKCIGTKEMKAENKLPDYPLVDFPKIPLYFRRSAINTAIDLARKSAETVKPNMVFYKGMYKEFNQRSIDLKLFNGERWVWVTYPFAGREFPEAAEKLSPMLVLDKKTAWLEVPVSFEIDDIRTVKERMEKEERVCALSFPDNDVLAVAVILDRNGVERNCRFFRGGKAKEGRRREILNRLHTSEESRGAGQRNKEAEIFLPEKVRENAAIYEEFRNLNRYYVHNISKRLLDFCLEQSIKVVVVPNYETGISFRDKRYLKTDAYRWLGRAIIKHFKYKAFKQGIVVTSIRACHTTDRCSDCGEVIRRYNEGSAASTNYHGGRLFLCPNGHKGNVAENTAKNIGRIFLSYFKKED